MRHSDKWSRPKPKKSVHVSDYDELMLVTLANMRLLLWKVIKLQFFF